MPTVGYGTYFGAGVDLREADGCVVAIGAYCSIADGVVVMATGEHHTDHVSTHPFRERLGYDCAPNTYSRGSVTIGSDVWIGAHAIILSGVTVGHGAVIGAGAVVRCAVEPFEVVAGVPARHIRHRFAPETCSRLLDLAWWEWPEAKVRAFAPLLVGDAATFMAAVDSCGS